MPDHSEFAGLNGRVSALSPTEMMRLDLWASTFVDAFDHGPWLVGSVLHRRNFRDVDVRLVLDDDDSLFADPDRLRLLNVGLSVWAQQMTGLPVDFQFQPGSEWAKHTEAGHRRNPLGHRWRTVHRASVTGSQEDPTRHGGQWVTDSSGMFGRAVWEPDLSDS